MRHVHFIGIGGAGMSGLAEILLERGIKVSGSDLVRSEKTDELKKAGAKIFIGHSAKHVTKDIDTVVYTSAAKGGDNPELIETEQRGITTFRRAEFLGELTKGLATIAVAGTHGKTTTASMIAHILIEAGADPLVSIGAKVSELGGKNSRAGKGNIAVVEADEYDKSFLALHPHIAVLTTLEAEHLDIYKDINDLERSFIEFANAHEVLKEQGYAVVNIDEPALRDILPKLEKKIITFGTSSEEAKFKAKDISAHELHTQATIIRATEEIGTLELVIPGEHNIKNALAAIAVSEILAIPYDLVCGALATFRGAERRSELIGEADGITVIDDYAHHPTEIRATLQSLRKGYPGRRILVGFQPHTFTRTRDFAEEFGKVFAECADELYLVNVYPAREKSIPGVTSGLILESSIGAGLRKSYFVGELEKLPIVLAEKARSGDLVLTIGAGTITEAAPKLLKLLKDQARKKDKRLALA
jgi:UDP-N-acetylmuramate--alanine ligase